MFDDLDVSNNLYSKKRPFHPSKQLLLGGGPTNCSARVLHTMFTAPILPPSDQVSEIMIELKEMLKFVFQTKNDVTLATQTSGTGGLETALSNVVDSGETIIVATNGFWGMRIGQMAKIRQIEVVEVHPKYSSVFEISELEEKIVEHRPVLLYITHGESSSGVLQKLEGLGKMCHKYNCLLFIDAIATMGAIPLHVDRWNIDIAVSATQKAARSLPGLAYLTFSQKAVERMRFIKTPPPLYYNILQLGAVWRCFKEHFTYHYTYNSNLLCAAKEGLTEIIENGLLETWKGHVAVNKRLWDGLEKIGLQFFVENPEHRLYTINCMYLPHGVTWESLNTHLMERYDIHLGVGIGQYSNKCFRIGIMGYNARNSVVDYLLEKLNEAIKYCQANTTLSNGV